MNETKNTNIKEYILKDEDKLVLNGKQLREWKKKIKLETLAEVEKMIWKYPNEFIMEAETKDEAESIKSEIIQKLKEMENEKL